MTTDTPDTSPDAVERLAHRLTVLHPALNRVVILGETANDAATTLRALSAERDALKAELAEAVGVLQKIESRPVKMTWGEDYEVSEAMRDMEETARAALRDLEQGGE